MKPSPRLPWPISSKTSRSELEAELEKSRLRESLFVATEHLARIGHYEWNHELDLLESCSEEYARLYNMTVDQVMAAQTSLEKCLDRIHPDDHESYKLNAQVLRNTKSLDVHYRILLDDDEIRHIREIGIIVKDGEGTEKGSFGILQDVTRQIMHERDLEYRDELSRQAESITDIGHFIFDEVNQTYLHVSDGFASIFLTTVEACLAEVQCTEDDLSDIHADDRNMVNAAYSHYINTGQECAIKYRINRSDGDVRWIRELSKAHRKKQGKVVQTIGVIQDITGQIKYEQELSFKDAINNEAEALTGIGFFLFDELENRNLFISPGQARIVGMEVDEYHEKIKSNQDYIDLIVEEDREIVRQAYEKNLLDHKGWEVEYRIQLKGGEIRWVRELGKALKTNIDAVEQTIGVLQDVTEQKKSEQVLLFKDALADQVEAITDIGHFIFDEINQKFLFVSPGLAQIFGLDAVDMVSRSGLMSRYSNLIHIDDRERVQKIYDHFMVNGGEWRVEYRLMRGDGEVRWVRELGKTHLLNRGIPEQTIVVLQDITDQKNAEQEIIKTRDTLEQQVVERTQELGNTIKQLQQEVREREKITAELDFLANHDALTGLPSLRLCKDRLERSIVDAHRNRQLAAVMFLDLDGFKDINDCCGHEFGDQVLKVTADRIKNEIRETDTVARIGGDEFLVILSSLPQIDIANRIATNLNEQLSRTIQIEKTEVTVSASIGIALYPNDGVTPEDLIRSADKAMYRVKHSSKNNFGFVDTDRLS